MAANLTELTAEAGLAPETIYSSRLSVSDDQQLEPSVSLKRSPSSIFPKVWNHSTEDRNLTLYGFRRFKTTHLVNLRYLEEEISDLDHRIYQAGLSLDDGKLRRTSNRLGLEYSHRDSNVPALEESITNSMVLRLRDLLRTYDDALASFNKLMAMETFSLIDDEGQSRERTDLHPYEKYRTRLVRADLGTRATHDPFRLIIHKALRRFQYRRTYGAVTADEEGGTIKHTSQDGKSLSYQNTALIAETLSRIFTSLMAGAFMVLPLVMVSYQTRKRDHLITISIWIVTFSLLVSATLRASNLTTIGVVATYAAVLSVFVSRD